MLDFFKDVYYEMQGFDLEQMKQLELQKEINKNKKLLLGSKIGAVLIALLIGAVIVITILNVQTVFDIFKYILMLIVEITALSFFIFTKNKLIRYGAVAGFAIALIMVSSI